MDEDKELYVFEYTLNQIIPKDNVPVTIDFYGDKKTITREGKFYYLEGWGLGTPYALYMYFKELENINLSI